MSCVTFLAEHNNERRHRDTEDFLSLEKSVKTSALRKYKTDKRKEKKRLEIEVPKCPENTLILSSPFALNCCNATLSFSSILTCKSTPPLPSNFRNHDQSKKPNQKKEKK